jgi:hypothetical protein
MKRHVREWTRDYRRVLVENLGRFHRPGAATPSSGATTMRHPDLLHIVSAEVVGDHLLRLEFDEQTVKTVDCRPLLEGPVFEPLKDPDYFARVVVDPVCGTVVWPNGADFAPEALYELPDAGAARKAN